jgi:hypothetical protein
MNREYSAAYKALRASARRVLRLIEFEVVRQGGCAVIGNDELELCGSRRVWRPALAELDALGLAEVTRFPNFYECRRSERWRTLRTRQEARLISAAAREADARRWMHQRAPARASVEHHV